MLHRYPLACALIVCGLLCSAFSIGGAKKPQPAAAPAAAPSESAVQVRTDAATGTVRVTVGGKEILRAEKNGFYEVTVPHVAAVEPKAKPCGDTAKESTEQGAGKERRSHD